MCEYILTCVHIIVNLAPDIRTRQWMLISAQHLLAFLLACTNVPGLSARFSADPATLQRDTSKDIAPSTANPGQFSFGSDWIVGECMYIIRTLYKHVYIYM